MFRGRLPFELASGARQVGWSADVEPAAVMDNSGTLLLCDGGVDEGKKCAAGARLDHVKAAGVPNRYAGEGPRLLLRWRVCHTIALQ